MAAFVDVEGAVKTFLWNHPDLDNSVGLFFTIPPNVEDKYPFITVEAAGGTNDRYVPIDSPRITLSVWGGINKKKVASDIALKLRNIFYEIEGVELDEHVYCYGAEVGNQIWLPENTDNENKLARYVVDVTITVRTV